MVFVEGTKISRVWLLKLDPEAPNTTPNPESHYRFTHIEA
ncbi:hypothetical protein X559_0128 [Paenilisteria newyorkensis]|nr:hypothetical protein X559_0128 [Listeria newyorkensis]